MEVGEPIKNDRRVRVSEEYAQATTESVTWTQECVGTRRFVPNPNPSENTGTTHLESMTDERLMREVTVCLPESQLNLPNDVRIHMN